MIPDLSLVRLDAQRRLLSLLAKFEGTKIIVWDDKLIGPFEFVANASLLRKHDALRLLRLSDVKLILADSPNADYTLFFLRKDVQVAKFVADVLQRVDRVSLSKTSLVFVPQRCTSIEKILELNKLDLSKLHSIEELNIEFFLLDTDILSMENEFVFRDIHLDDDHSAIHQIVEGLVKLQAAYGQIPRICGQGKAAKLVFDLLHKRRKQSTRANNQADSLPSQINQLILIDRKVDLVTPLLTQLTYEGLLDEIFGIQSGVVTLPGEKFQKLDEKNKEAAKSVQAEVKGPKKFELKSGEVLFAKLRDCHINAVADTLKQSARKLQAEYDECNSEGKTIHEMGKIIKRLQHLKTAKTSQSNHVTIAELVNEQTLKQEFIFGLRIEHEILQDTGNSRVIPDIDTKLLKKEPVFHVLRLICIQSMVNNGFKSKICDHYKQEIIQNYGFDYLLLLMRLEAANLLLGQEKFHENGGFTQLRNKLDLINDNIDECNPNHLSYVYGGYAPISVIVAKTLAQSTHQAQWRATSEFLRLLPEPTLTHSDLLTISNATLSQTYPDSAASAARSFSSSIGEVTSLATNYITPSSFNMSVNRVRRNSTTSSQSSSEESKVVLVFFIGGCTFAEISALRFLAQQDDNNCEFIIGTTKIINGKNFLDSLWPLAYEGKADLYKAG